MRRRYGVFTTASCSLVSRAPRRMRLTLFEKFEEKLERYPGNLQRARGGAGEGLAE